MKGIQESENSTHKALQIFRGHGGLLRARDAENLGIRRKKLCLLTEAGLVERLTRGVYRLTDMQPLVQPDIAVVASRIPDGVICLLSALSFHKLTTHNPQAISVALSRTRRRVKIDWPPVKFYLFASKAFLAGVETHLVDGVPVQVYSKEKTLADCFKFRNRIGIDVVLEALRHYRESSTIDVRKLIHFAEICRVKRVMLPYIEAIL